MVKADEFVTKDESLNVQENENINRNELSDDDLDAVAGGGVASDCVKKVVGFAVKQLTSN